MSTKGIYFSRFEPNLDAGGGCRRLAQIRHVFAGMNLDLIMAEEGENREYGRSSIFTRISQMSRITDFIGKSFVAFGEHKFWHKEHRNIVYNYQVKARRLANAIRMDLDISFALVDDPIYFKTLLTRLQQNHIPIIAICHNLESLSPNQSLPKRQRILFNKELNILSRCHLVITISREETFLLKNLNINTLFLPYYPVDAILRRMLKIRDSRKKTKKKDILLLGTATNKPTKLGMLKVFEEWKRNSLAHLGEKLLVAGYGTDIVRESVHGKGMEFLGSLPKTELDRKLSCVKACLCYQEQGSGALTRIPEMLIAGIPVLANTHAARSYHNLKGITEFSRFADLPEAIKKTESLERRIPVPSPPDFSLLVSEIGRLLDTYS